MNVARVVASEWYILIFLECEIRSLNLCCFLKLGQFCFCFMPNFGKGQWFSRVLPLMLWCLSAWFPYFYSDWPWSYCDEPYYTHKSALHPLSLDYKKNGCKLVQINCYILGFYRMLLSSLSPIFSLQDGYKRSPKYNSFTIIFLQRY